MRAVLAKQNKDLFEKIRNAALSNEKVLKKFQEYDAQSHKDKVSAAKTVADLRVSYFHYVRRVFCVDCLCVVSSVCRWLFSVLTSAFYDFSFRLYQRIHKPFSVI